MGKPGGWGGVSSQTQQFILYHGTGYIRLNYCWVESIIRRNKIIINQQPKNEKESLLQL